MVYICTNFHENILDGLEVIERSRFHSKISKGHNVGVVTVLVLCTLSNGGLYFYKFHENILSGIKVVERTRFSSEKFKRAIIP